MATLLSKLRSRKATSARAMRRGNVFETSMSVFRIPSDQIWP